MFFRVKTLEGMWKSMSYRAEVPVSASLPLCLFHNVLGYQG